LHRLGTLDVEEIQEHSRCGEFVPPAGLSAESCLIKPEM
jgi:hypothetical protein